MHLITVFQTGHNDKQSEDVCMLLENMVICMLLGTYLSALLQMYHALMTVLLPCTCAWIHTYFALSARRSKLASVLPC